MAGCEKCKRKFFTPTTYSSDALGAQEYLFSKFDHRNARNHARNPTLRGDSKYWRDNYHLTSSRVNGSYRPVFDS